jgi:hypothetical protein
VGKELVHDRTKVVYSEHYYDSKKLDIPNDAWPEDPNPKYVGTIVDFDPDGLMTNVLWPDGSVEYCCTGYSNKFFLALVDRPEEEEVTMKKKMGKKDWKEEAAFSPKWTLQPSGMFSVPFKPKHRQIRTASQVAAAVKRLHSKLSKISDKNSEEYLAVDREYQIASAELKEMNIDRESMASWIEVDVNGEHFKIAPSQLAPPASASLGTKQPSILSQVRKEVRREAEKVGAKPLYPEPYTQSRTFAHRSSTLNPKPWTLNPKPWIASPEPSTQNHDLSLRSVGGLGGKRKRRLSVRGWRGRVSGAASTRPSCSSTTSGRRRSTGGIASDFGHFPA